MKKHLILLPLLSFIITLTSCSDGEDINMEVERQQALKVLDDFIEAHEIEDLDLLLSCFSDKPDIIILGTDADELWVDKVSFGDSQKRAYGTFDKISLSVRDKMLKLCDTGKHAWFYMKVDWFVESGGERYIFDDIRTTGVLVKENNKWAIVLLHTSLPVKGKAVHY